MKSYPVHKHIAKTPVIFGLPMAAGGLFFGISIGNAILVLLVSLNPLVKIAALIFIPLIVYIGMFAFFSFFSVGSFSKQAFSKKIVVIKNKSLAHFKIYDHKD